MDEFAFIERLRRRLPAPGVGVRLGIGDDAAVVAPAGAETVVAVDMVVEGTHFDLACCTPEQVGRKAVNVNLSDFAAMAAVPRWAVVAVAVPPGSADPDAVFAGIADAAGEHGVSIVGGDTTAGDRLTIAVTVLGDPPANGVVRRDTGRAGDVLLVTGPLGYSLDGRHLDFSPRVAEAQGLHALCELHAMLDLSDGLGGDLFHLTTGAGLGAVIDGAAVPVRSSPLAAGSSRSPLDHALHDGEDFELLLAVAPADADRLLATQPVEGVTLTAVGRLTSAPDVLLIRDGGAEPLSPGGFRHRW